MHFFFQAEDGIRDKLVTGVQTCALPICKGLRREHVVAETDVHTPLTANQSKANDPPKPFVGAPPTFRTTRSPDSAERTRSEERRVGKEGRSRWQPGE